MVYEQEQEAGFQYFLGIANKRYNVHFSKLMLILIDDERIPLTKGEYSI